MALASVPSLSNGTKWFTVGNWFLLVQGYKWVTMGYSGQQFSIVPKMENIPNGPGLEKVTDKCMITNAYF